VILTPLDATEGVVYSDLFRREQSDDARLRHVAEYVRRSNNVRVPMWDEVVAATLIDPSLIVTSHQSSVSVTTAREADYGKTSDQRAVGNVVIITAVDAERVEPVLLNALTASSGN
jgi:inosine-uridine nucleoside N-ribohydrolase